MSNKWAFRALAQGSVLDIEIYDVVDPNAYSDPWWGSYGVSARQILDTLRAAQDVTQINVRINSAGGDVFDGMAIYNLLHQHSARVRVQVDGLCASIASIIAMAGDDIVMGEGTWMMIHKPYSAFMAECGSDDLRKTADVLDKMTESMCAVYCARTGQKPEAVLAAMTAETWMTAAEAKSLGYCTEVTPANAPGGTETEDAESKAMAAALLKTFARMPAGAFQAMARAHKDMKMTILASANAQTKAPIVAAGDAGESDLAEALKKAKRDLEDLRDEHKKDKAKMAEDLEKAKKAKEDAENALADFKKKSDDDDGDEESSSGADDKKAEARALAKLGLTAVALTGTKNLIEAEAALVALAAKTDKLQKLDEEMAVLRKERHQARVSQLIAEGKLKPSRKEWALAASSSDIDTYLAATGGEALVPMNIEHRQPEAKSPESGAATGRGTITAQDRAIAKHSGLTEEQLQQAADLRFKKFGI
jgi:ATP-dependent protease ClpP protease subunit